jgi:hypothetical protein
MTLEVALLMGLIFLGVAVNASYLGAVGELFARLKGQHRSRWRELSMLQTWLEPSRGLFLWSPFWGSLDDQDVEALLRRARSRLIASWVAVLLVMALAGVLLGTAR